MARTPRLLRFPRRFFLHLFALCGLFVLLLFLWGITVLSDLKVFLPYAGQLTGFPFGGEKRYLVLLQNNDELRGGGGFITAYGILTFRHGLPTSFHMEDVYSLQGYRDENIRPVPKPMEFFFEDPFFRGYSFHDGNWSPDFPTVAQEVLNLYREDEGGGSFDGVIAVNLSLIEELLGLTGGITVDGTRYTKENFFVLLEHEVNNMDRHNKEALLTRKSHLPLLQKALLQRLALGVFRYGKVTHLLSDALDRKDIQLYFTDPSLTRLLASQKWDGKFWRDSEEQPRDIFSVVVANLGAGKTDRYVRKHYQYDVRVDRVGRGYDLTGKVALTFTHLGDQNVPVSFRYRSFVRTYLPKGVEVKDLPKGFTVDQEFGHTVVSGMIEMNPGESQTIAFSTVLPGWLLLDDQLYKLLVIPQSGVRDALYSLSLHLPQDYLVRNPSWKVRDNISYFDGPITEDTLFTTYYTKDTLSPRVSAQRFEDVNKLVIEFNEPLQQEGCEDALHYTIEDKNVTIPEKTDQVTIRQITCEDRRLVILTRGISLQKEEHYRVQFSGLRDLHGNLFSPDPKDITLVQRF